MKACDEIASLRLFVNVALQCVLKYEQQSGSKAIQTLEIHCWGVKTETIMQKQKQGIALMRIFSSANSDVFQGRHEGVAI